MDSQTTSKKNATEAWSQLLYSIISDNPPPSMTRAYYYARPLPIQILQEQLKRYGMERYYLWAKNAQPQARNFLTLALRQPPIQRTRYHQEIRHIQDRLEFAKLSEKLQANKDKYQQWTEHIRYFMRVTSNELVRANKGGLSKEWSKQIQYLTWRIRNIMTSILDDEMVQVNDDKYQQGIERIQSVTRSNVFLVDNVVVQANEDKYQQGIEHIQSLTRSNEVGLDDEQVQEHEDKYQQGIEHIQSFTRTNVSRVDNEVVQANQDKYQQGIEHIQSLMRSNLVSVDDGVLQADEDKYKQGIEHIQSFTRSNMTRVDNEVVQDKYLQGIEHIRSFTRSNGVCLDDEQVQENEDKYQQGIEHIQYFTRSNVAHVDNKVVQANENKHLQGIEHIQYFTRSNVAHVDNKVVQANENKHLQGIEHIRSFTRSNGVCLDDKQMQENEDKYQQGIEHIQSFTRSNMTRVDNEVVQANEDMYQQGIEHNQSLMRSNLVSVDNEVLQADEDKYQQGIEYIQFVMRSNVGNELVQKNESKHQQGNEHIQSVMGTTVDEEMVRAYEAKYPDEIEHERAVLLSLLAFLEFVEDQIWEENQTLRSEVLEAYELMHENGAADIVRSQMEGKDPKIQYQEKRLELLLRICDQEICLKIIDNEIQKVGGDVYCKHCEMFLTNEGNELGIKHAKELSNLFDNLLELVESIDVHKEKKPAVQVKVLKLIKILHHYGVDTIRNAVEKELEDVKQKYDDTEEDPSIQYMKKGLEVMLRICGNKSYERTINKIGHKAETEYDPLNFKIMYNMR